MSTASHISEFRDRFVKQLPELGDEFIDSVRADGSPAAYEKLMNVAVKVIEGLQVDNKAKYDNLPVVNVIIGVDVVTTNVTPPQVVEEVKPAIEDATPKSDWPFPKVEAAQAQPEFDALGLLDAVSQGMVLPDEET